MGRVAVTGGAVLAMVLGAPGVAGAAYVNSITLYSDQGDFIGQGVQRVFHPGNAPDMGARVEDDGVRAWVVPPGGAEAFSFSFAAPRGQTLEPANYIDAERLPFREPGHPGMEVMGGNRGCNQIGGRFELRDLAIDGTGAVRRLWVVFQQHCEGDPRAAFGEIRIGAWVPDAAARVVPGIVRWPPLDAWRRATRVPVTYVGPAAVTAVTVAGPHAGDFQADASGCAGRSGPCDISVAFNPSGAGAREATLRITDASGSTHETALEAFAHGGTTLADVEVLPGNLGGDQGRYVWGPDEALFHGRTSETETLAYAERPSGDYWYARFGAGGPTPLAPGYYPNADASYGARPWLKVLGTHTGCNQTGGEFTVNSISRMPEGTLRTFDVAFRADCYDDHRAALRGRFQYRAGSDEPLPAWMYPGPRPRIEAPPDPPPAGPGAPGGAGAAAGERALAAHCPDAVERGVEVRRGSVRADRIRGGPGSDFILAGPGDDRVKAGAGLDCVSGGKGRDRLWGGSGADVVRGGSGADVLIGGAGRDTLDCGGGRRDRARAGRRDRVRRCERVRRTR